MKIPKKFKLEQKAWGNNIFFYKLTLKPIAERKQDHPNFATDQHLEATTVYVKFDGDTNEFFVMKADKGTWPPQKEAMGNGLRAVMEYNYLWETSDAGDFFLALL